MNLTPILKGTSALRPYINPIQNQTVPVKTTNDSRPVHRKVKNWDPFIEIGPWWVDDAVITRKNKCNKQKKLRTLATERLDLRVDHKGYGVILIEENEHRSQLARRSKTERPPHDEQMPASKIKLSTVAYQNTPLLSLNPKYYSLEQTGERKMSMTRFRTNTLAADRPKGSTHEVMGSLHDRQLIETKLSTNYQYMHGKPGHPCSSAKAKEPRESNRLMFYFEARNGHKVINREKNIMKLRNLGATNKNKTNI